MSDERGEGLSLRDYFAGMALISVASKYSSDKCEQAARDCYKFADAILKERET